MNPFTFTFPGGRRVVKAIAATAGNVAKSLSPTSGKRWKILWGEVTIVCDATVQNRYVKFYLRDGTNITLSIGNNNTAYTASQTKKIAVSSRRAVGSSDAVKLNDSELLLPQPCILEGADDLYIVVTNGQAGDSYSGYVVLLEIDA